MKVKRIVSNISTKKIKAAKRFYQDALGLDLLMDHGEEPWGVRRFFVKDPFGKTVNILEHLQ